MFKYTCWSSILSVIMCKCHGETLPTGAAPFCPTIARAKALGSSPETQNRSFAMFKPKVYFTSGSHQKEIGCFGRTVLW